MLRDSFYFIIEQCETDDSAISLDNPVRKFTFTIKLNPDHPVYKGHFPGNPVVPGVCQVQMIKELTSLILKTDLVIHQSDNIKFLSMIIPSMNNLLKISIDIKEKGSGSWHVNSVIKNEDVVFLKFKGIMKPFSKQL
jgi:3-hydroxyacyl-[acyl-carrier-protein] dehydratase